MATTPQYNFNVNRQDLDFILKQIKIAEGATLPNGQIDGTLLRDGIAGAGAQPSAAALLPYGLRTVDGTWNNLLPGQERVGAADNLMPRLVPINLQAADVTPAGFGPPTPTSYAQNSGLVFDAQPRLISNLIVDQTANNPVAVQSPPTRRRRRAGRGSPPTARFAEPSRTITRHRPVAALQRLDDLLRPVLRPRPGPRDQGRQRHGVHPAAAGRSAVRSAPGSHDQLHGPDAGHHRRDQTTCSAPPTTSTSTSNTTTPFVDQNQTYTSHPSHQVFLREYALRCRQRPLRVDAGTALASMAIGTGGPTVHGDMATWGEVKAQAAAMLGIILQRLRRLRCAAAGDRPLRQVHSRRQRLRADRHETRARGRRPGGQRRRRHRPAGQHDPHRAMPSSTTSRTTRRLGRLRRRRPDARRTDADHRPADGITDDGRNRPAPTTTKCSTRHFITGDGRGNENIGLTAVHSHLPRRAQPPGR